MTKYRQTILWLIWLAVVIAVLWYFVQLAVNAQATPMPPNLSRTVKSKLPRLEHPTQGSGALALISRPLVVQSEPVQVFYFAATAVDTFGQESDFSTEISWTNTSALRAKRVTLAWNPSPSTNVIAAYKVYRGRAPRTYTTNFSAGTNLFLTIPLYPPPLTNIVLTVVCTNGGTNIAWSSSLRGPWSKLNTNRYTAVNLSSPRYFRGLGPSGNRLLIKAERK